MIAYTFFRKSRITLETSQGAVMPRDTFAVRLTKAERDTLRRMAQRDHRTEGQMLRLIFAEWCRTKGVFIVEDAPAAQAEQKRLEGFGK